MPIRLNVTVRRHSYVCVTDCGITVPVGTPRCVINAITRPVACGDTASYCVAVTPSGGTYTFLWSITGGGTILTDRTSQCVRVRIDNAATLSVVARRNGCSTSCELPISVGVPICDIVPVIAGPTTCGDTASFCARVTPPGGVITYQWTITGGTIVTDPTASCVQVKVDGTFTLRVVVTRNGCSTRCEISVPFEVPVVTFNRVKTTMCVGDTGTFCITIALPGGGSSSLNWFVIGSGGGFVGPTTGTCVVIRATVGGSSFTVGAVATPQNGCASDSALVVVTVPPAAPYLVCRPAYPDQSHLPQSKGTLDNDSVVVSFDPKTGGALPCVVGDTLLRIFYTSDRVMLLGYRQVQVKTSSGTTTVNYPITSPATTPMRVNYPVVGDTIPTGDFRYGDWYERPVFPALWITDISNDPKSRAGDWAYKVARALPDTGAIPPHKVCGLWKSAVRFYDKTLPSIRAKTISDMPDPPKNFWNLGPGSDVPTEGFAALPSKGYGAEAAWDLRRLGLVTGHAYRLFFSMYEGGDNPHPNLGCIYINLGSACPSGAGSGALATSAERLPEAGLERALHGHRGSSCSRTGPIHSTSRPPSATRSLRRVA